MTTSPQVRASLSCLRSPTQTRTSYSSSFGVKHPFRPFLSKDETSSTRRPLPRRRSLLLRSSHITPLHTSPSVTPLGGWARYIDRGTIKFSGPLYPLPTSPLNLFLLSPPLLGSPFLYGVVWEEGGSGCPRVTDSVGLGLSCSRGCYRGRPVTGPPPPPRGPPR